MQFAHKTGKESDVTLRFTFDILNIIFFLLRKI